MKILSDLPTVRFLLLFLGFTAALTVTTTTAQAQAAPDIVVEDLAQVEISNGTSHDFGAVQVRGEKKSRYVRLWNRGVGPLVIQSLDLDGSPQGDFFIGVPTTPFEIAAGQYQQVEMGFDPASTGVKNIKFVISSNDQDELTYELPLTGTGIQPQMVVEKADGSPIAHQQAQSYGFVGVGTDSDLSFTLKNPGSAVLVTQISLVGPPTVEFTLQTHPLQTVYPGETKTITVRYRPGEVGAHQATLRIASNLGLADPDPLFDIPLTGTGEKTTFFWAAPLYTAMHDATSVTLTLKRTPANIPASVGLLLMGSNSHSPPYFDADRNVDYTPLTGPEETVSFAAGQAEKTVVIQLLAPAARAHINRELLIAFFKLSGSHHHIEFGTPSAALVHIVAADNVKPTLQITAPAAAAKFSTLSPTVLVSAKASDNQGIDRVMVSLNGGTPQGASGAPTNVASNGTYSLDVTPVNGPNQITVTAFDPKGNSTSLSRSFTYQRRRHITLFAHELYTPASPTTAAVTVTGAPVALSSEAPGGVVKPASVLPGTKFKFVCAAKLPHVFDQWSVQPFPADLQMSGNTCTFTMPDADLVIRALTVPTPFLPPAGGTNRLHTVIDQDPVDGPGSSYKAHLTGTLTSAGTFTGKLFIAGQTVALTAAIQTRSQALFTVAGKKQDSLTVPGGTLRIFPSAHEGSPFLAILTPEDTSLPGLEGNVLWAAYSPTRKLPVGLQNQANGSGLLTVSIAPPDPGLHAPGTVPQGHGYASVTLGSAGTVTLAGVLADGTPITMSSDLHEDLWAPLYVQLPTPGATTKLGLLLGKLQFTETANVITPVQPANLIAGLNWYRPSTTSPKVLLYPQGWPHGTWVPGTGAKYDPRLAYNVGLNLASTTTASTPNAALSFTGGSFTDKLISNLNLRNFTVTKIPASDATYTLTLSAATGLFSGTFTPPAGAPAGTGKPAFKGILLNRAPYHAGHGHFLNHATPAKATHAGSVTLSAPPPAAD